MIETLPEEKIFLSINLYGSVEKQMAEALEHKTAKIRTGQMLQKDVNALGAAKRANSVIFGITLGKTARKQILRELEICNMQKIRVLGIITISE